MNKKITVEKGSTNVFADLGYPNPEEALFKAKLIYQINSLIKKKRLKQTQAAKLLGTQQARISELKRGIISGFSTERLLHFLRLLNCDLELRVRPRRPSKRGPKMSVQLVAWIYNPLYVLHVFQKKSKRGIATPKEEVDMIRERLKWAEEDYKKRLERR